MSIILILNFLISLVGRLFRPCWTHIALPGKRATMGTYPDRNTRGALWRNDGVTGVTG